VLLQRLRDQETRAVLQLIDGGRHTSAPSGELARLAASPEAARPVAESTGGAPVDLSTLQVYEEYR
jgi:hypothetical protein